MSYYTKYRPQKIAELDLDKAREVLGRIIQSGNFAQAYLLTGPKGTGKTSSARILAKVLNCVENAKNIEAWVKTGNISGKLVDACGKCEMCEAIRTGSSLGVMEMDAASNRGIDDIRELKERIGLAPAQGRIMVYVIDEVHMLTTEAFNALLKTLEEPPRHVVFVLCTTEAHKVPETIMSRCTRIQYGKATAKEVMNSLNKVVKGEDLKVEKEALAKIASRVDGSFRDGVKLLEQLSQQGGEITVEMVDELTGFSGEYEVEELVKALEIRDVRTALKIVREKVEQGIDASLLGKRLVERLHEQMIHKISEGDQEKARQTRALLEVLVTEMNLMQKTPIASLPLEMAIVRWCLGESDPSGNRGDSGENKIDVGDQREPQKMKVVKKIDKDRKNEAVRVEADEAVKDVDHEISEVSVIASDSQSVTETNSQAEVVMRMVGEVELELSKVMEAWPQLVQKVKPYNQSVVALLRAAEPYRCEANWVEVKVYYTFHKEQLEQERHRKLLEEVFSDHLGTSVKLRFTLGEKVMEALRADQDTVNVTGKVDEKIAEAAEEIFG